jgi:hypothetical protein
MPVHKTARFTGVIWAQVLRPTVGDRLVAKRDNNLERTGAPRNGAVSDVTFANVVFFGESAGLPG